MKAFGYLRVSGLGQVDGDGFERQRDAISRYAAAHEIQVVEFFEERGVSGKNELSDRPTLSELMLRLEENGTRTVVIEKLDRLARDLMIQETILADFRKRGFTLISAMEPDLCSEDPSRVLMRQIFGAIAQYDRAVITMKLAAARKRKKDRGLRCEGRKPFGTKPGEAETLAEMRRLHSSGLSYAEIAGQLEEQGRKTRMGGQWRAQSVHQILSRTV